MSQALLSQRRHNEKPKHRLDASKIIETAKYLSDDINARLPGSSLSGLAQELALLAIATDERGKQARQPILIIRVFSFVVVGLGVLAIIFFASHVHAKWSVGTIGDLFSVINSGTNLLLLLSGALWFCLTLETRIKRKEALGFIEELREFIHVIDVTQLYYTPDLYRSRLGTAPTSLAIDETYLLYCTQMLAVISNLAPLYTRGSTGDSILRTASEVEMLAIAVSTKHLSKAHAVLMMSKDLSRFGPPPSQ